MKHVHRPNDDWSRAIGNEPLRSFCLSCGKRIRRVEASDRRREYWRLVRPPRRGIETRDELARRGRFINDD